MATLTSEVIDDIGLKEPVSTITNDWSSVGSSSVGITDTGNVDGFADSDTIGITDQGPEQRSAVVLTDNIRITTEGEASGESYSETLSVEDSGEATILGRFEQGRISDTLTKTGSYRRIITDDVGILDGGHTASAQDAAANATIIDFLYEESIITMLSGSVVDNRLRGSITETTTIAGTLGSPVTLQGGNP